MQETLTRIKAMRFPLIVLVVTAHALGFSTPELSLSGDGWNIFHFVTEGISHNFCRIAVCSFFILSGFFFFYGKEDTVRYDLPWFRGKWERRIRTVLIPFLAWNLILLLATWGKISLFSALGFAAEPDERALLAQGPLHWFFLGPANFPLWYMRDLVILSLLAPLLPPLFRLLGKFTPVVLVLLYLSPWNPGIPSMRAIFYFCIGAWLGMRRTDLLACCRSVRIPCYIAAALLLPAVTFFTGKPVHEWCLRVFYPFGIISFANLADSLFSNRKGLQDKMTVLSESVFFIYAAHEIFILGWTKGLLFRLLGDGLGAAWLSYFLVPPIVLGVCLILYRILKKIAPKPLAFICGGRI